MDPMLGMIYLVPFNWAPNGYLICQGQTVAVTQYLLHTWLVAICPGLKTDRPLWQTWSRHYL